jgi:hypothetical protein
MRQSANRRCSFWSALVLGCALGAGSHGACAQPGSDYHDRDAHYKDTPHAKNYVIRRDHPVAVPPKRMRHYRDVVVLRPYGHWYSGYGRYHTDSDAFKWLALTAITLKILDNLNEAQERAHEEAQVRATTAPIGETIIWQDGAATGSVTATREGTSTAGRYCREFQQKVSIGGHSEEAYGTACMQPDGSWEVVSTGR